MKDVFISWSGDKSKDIASKIKTWLPTVIQTIRPWMSEDIQAGVRWSSEISKRLSESRLGIICVTQDNMNSRWLHFEAGAISKELGDDARVYPILIDLTLEDVQYPLAQFQSIELTEDGLGILKLISSLNQITENPYPSDVVNILFAHYWPKLKDKILDQIVKKPNLSYSYLDTYHFQNVNDQLFFEDLFRSINYKDIFSIDIMGHTGENIVRSFLSTIAANESLIHFLRDNEIPLRILLRDPVSEVSGRVLGIRRTLGEIEDHCKKGLNLQLHFYQNLPVFRSILFRLRRADFPNRPNVKGFVGFYYFPAGGASKKHPQRLLVDDSQSNKNQIIEIHDSWFSCFWGKSTTYKEINTIIFDFDDTIVSSHRIQVEAWVELIEYAITNKEIRTKELCGIAFDGNEKIIVDKNKLTNNVREIFFRKQMASLIFDEIFEDMDEDLKNHLHQRRFKNT